MARPATGWTEWRKDTDGTPRWHVWITLPGGKGRHPYPLDPDIKAHETDRAREVGAFTSRWYREHGVAPETGAETACAWFKRLHAAKDVRGLATVKDMRGRASAWILPGIEHKAMAKITREDIEAIVRRLDAAVRAFQKGGPGNGRLAPSTAANVWGDLSHAFDEAVRAKDPGLRVLAVNPAANVRGPETGEDREAPILYSDEIVTLLRGVADESDGKRHLDVPLYRRHVYALALYTAARASELEALTAGDVDLARMTITISKQADRASKGRKDTKATKTKRTRTVDIEPHIAGLVDWLVKHPQGKAGRLLRMPAPEDRAELLRRDLCTVGVTREALHIERDPLRRAITLHDCRDTCLTHLAVRGDSPIAIQWRAGHTDYKMTSGYIDRGRVEARRIGEPLPPLPPEVLPEAPSTEPDAAPPAEEEATGFASVSLSSETRLPNYPFSLGYIAIPTGIEDPQSPGNAADRRASGGAKPPPAPANPAIPGDANPGQEVRTGYVEHDFAQGSVRETLGALTVARLEKLTPEQRRELREMLAEDDAPNGAKGAA